MGTVVSLGVVALLGLGGVLPAKADLPKKPAPQGMREVATGGNGRILTTQLGGTSSARKMLTALKYVSGEYFDAPLTVTRAFVDRGDSLLQAAFTAKLKGVPVRGVVAVRVDGTSGEGTMVFDDAKTFGKSFGTLLKKQGGGAGGGKMAAVRLTRQTAPDGSSQINLPEGFRIANAYKGTLDITGPQGAVMALGAPTLVTNRGAGAPGLPGVDFNDPVRAMADYVRYQEQTSGTRIQLTIIDSKPVASVTGGRAAFIRYSLQANGQAFEGFGLFSISPTDVNQALLYQSFILAPRATYRTQFPGMLQAWGSWSINPSVFTERLLAAANSMRGMSDIITSVDANRQATYAKVNGEWSDYIRDQSTWVNPNDGGRYKVPNTNTNPTVNGVPLQPVLPGSL